jgi:catechol-2,3-dioxygenase
MSRVKRLNHAVLYVRDAAASAAFYEEILGLRPVHTLGEGAAVFLRAAESDNDHDLGLFTIGADPRAGSGRQTGLYHLAWEVATLDDLVAMRTALTAKGALVGASDHGATKSLYAHDPDGIEFEVMWQLPLDEWEATGEEMGTSALDLDAEMARFGGATRSRTV